MYQIIWYESSFNNGNSGAANELGHIYKHRMNLSNHKKAKYWYGLAAKGGQKDSIFALAYYAIFGSNKKTDMDKGMRLLNQAADLGVRSAVQYKKSNDLKALKASCK